MHAPEPALVPELDVADLAASLAFYANVMGFTVAAERPEEGFAYLICEDAHLMLQAASGPGRRFRAGPLEYPFGGGVNLQIRVTNVEEIRAAAAAAGLPVLVELEERWYRQGDVECGNRQFVVEDPDGYVLRPFTDLGRRRAQP
jgi:catechol 2,3-dioxygenase-like lactoylglutathione lyase family enzyme